MTQSRDFFRPLDAFLILLVAAASAWGFMSFRVTEGSRAVVFIGDGKYGWYTLDGPKRQVSIPTSLGTVRMEIGDGTVRVAASPCRNKVCVKTGAIRHSHSEIVCMPAHLLIVVEGDEPDGSAREGTDAVTF
ncbi:MAG: hypothetical protein JWP91_4363 [Fibrobacteres bacterium]|nr:hypothetical protein [Fibrobacterota bacterium]